MKYRLVIAEKPSVAQSIATVLSAKSVNPLKREDGFIVIGKEYIVSWCFGHLVELAPPEEYGTHYKRWALDTLPIIPEHWKYVVAKDKEKQLDILHKLMDRKDVDCIINSCDAGKEGENIFRAVYNYCKCKKQVLRLWVASMEEETIRKAFDNLRPGHEYDNLYHAALCRSKADWLIGYNLTRTYSTIYGCVLSVGRVQSPTLAMIAEREVAINQFIPEPFYIPEIKLRTGNGSTGFTASGERLKDSAAAEAIRSACDGNNAVCLSVEKQRKATASPRLYDLTALQREANRLFGYTAQQTMQYVQTLYENKRITYPRTNSRFLTPDMESGIPPLIQALRAILPFSYELDFPVNAACVINPDKVTDHTAIIPTKSAANIDLAALPAGERNILYMLIVRLICAVAPVHSYETVTAVFKIGKSSETGAYNKFTAKGHTVLEDGWKTIDNAFRATMLNKYRDDDTNESAVVLPEIHEGQIFPSVTASVREGKTTPPRRLTEDTLLSAMETAGKTLAKQGADIPDDFSGIGTPATRANIIEKLIRTGFVKREKKDFALTDKGLCLIKILPEALKSPLLTADWENKLLLVEQGKLSETEFMDGISDMTRKLVKRHSVPVEEYKDLFVELSTKENTSKNDSVGFCYRCKNPVVERGTGFFCSNPCCSFVLWKDNRFFSTKKKTLTKAIANALLREGRIFISDLYSERTGKTYGATVVMVDTGGKYTNFKLEFEGGNSK